MTLGMDVTFALTELRAQAESMMTSTCTVTRVDAAADSNWNPATKQYEPATSTVYDGPCRVRPFGHRDHTDVAADQVFASAPHILSLPLVGSEGVRKDDLVTVVTSEDPGLVGVQYTVIDAAAYSNGTARRMLVRSVE